MRKTQRVRYPRREMMPDGTDPWFIAATLGLSWDEAKVYVSDCLKVSRRLWAVA